MLKYFLCFVLIFSFLIPSQVSHDYNSAVTSFTKTADPGRISIEVIKELPATLVLRPFNFDTLSISAYIYASDERMVEAAAPSIGIVLISLIPILLLIKILDKDKNE